MAPEGADLMFTRKSMVRLVVAVSAVLVLAAPVSASGAVKTTITIDNNFGPPTTESFTTTGGALCPSGSSHTDSITITGLNDRAHAVTFHGIKTLHCDDGSGTFRITFEAGGTPNSPGDQGGWRVIDGTGSYSTVSGGGNLVGTNFDGGIVDLYTGSVQL
jgi:hypothetical protein